MPSIAASAAATLSGACFSLRLMAWVTSPEGAMSSYRASTMLSGVTFNK